MQRQNIFTGVKIYPAGDSFPANHSSKQSTNPNNQFLSIKENNLIVRTKQNFKLFRFDTCLGKHQTQHEIYDNFCLTLAEDFVEGYDSTLIICGDNHNKTGNNDLLLGKDSEETKGILPRFIDHMTNSIKYHSERKFLFKVSFLEINNEQMIDLLGVKKCKLQIKQDKANKNLFLVNNLETKVLQKIDEIESFYLVGNRKRQYAYSKQYRKRENSTTFFTIQLESLQENGTIYRSSRFVFCELASNSFEELKNSNENKFFTSSISSRMLSASQGQRTGFMTKKQLNLSNYSFQNVVNTIVYGDDSIHVPYNDSKVTKLLRQALGGNMKTAILGILDAQNSTSMQKSFRILKTLQTASQIQTTPSNLKEIPSTQNHQSIIVILQQIHRLSTQLDKCKLELEILTNNSQYVSTQLEKMKSQQDHELIKDNQFCTEENMEDQVVEEKTKKEWELKREIKSLEKQIREKISCIHNLHNEQENSQNGHQHTTNFINQEEIISKRKQILLRVKNIKQKRLNSLPLQTQLIDRQKKRQLFALQIEFQKQRNLFTSTIRSLEEQLSFYKQIAQSYLKSEEIEIIRTNSRYDDTKREFELPMFMIKDRKTKGMVKQEGFTSERKFLFSPRSNSFNSYYSINSSRNSANKNKLMNFHKKMENILQRKPKTSQEYHTQDNQTNNNNNNIERHSIDQPGNNNNTNQTQITRPQTTRLLTSKSRQSKSPFNSMKMNFSKNNLLNKKQSNQHVRNVRSEYQLQSVNINRVISYNQQRDKQKIKQREKQKQKQKLGLKNNNSQAGPFQLMKRQKLYTELIDAHYTQDNTKKAISPPRSPRRREDSVKSPVNHPKRWV